MGGGRRRGPLETVTVVRTPVAHQPAELPYALGIIKLEGADTGLVHLVDAEDLDELEPGMRVEAVFREEGEGNIHDIRHFTRALGSRPASGPGMSPELGGRTKA